MKSHPLAGTIVILSTLIIFSFSWAAPGGKETGGKPGDEEPTPTPIDGAACAAHADFPALAYEIESIANEGKRQETRRYEVFLANGDASCSILLYSGDQSIVEPNSYRQVGIQGLILGTRPIPRQRKNECLGTEIFSMSFDVIDREIVTPLPLATETVYQYLGCPGGLFDPVLSPDGGTIFFGTEVPSGDPDNAWLDTLEMIDLSACAPPACTPQVLFAAYGRPVTKLSLNETGDRIFMNTDDRSDGTYGIMFMQRDSGATWSDPKYVVNNRDTGYGLARFGAAPTSVANWAWSGGAAREILAFPREEQGLPQSFDVLDVEACDISMIGTTCIEDASASVIYQAVPGAVLGFTSYGSATMAPNLYVLRNSEDYLEIDLASLVEIRTLLPGETVRGMDSSN